MSDFASEVWQINGFNTWQIIVIRDGADDMGRTYVDGRHQLTVMDCNSAEEAMKIKTDHNASLSLDH